MGSFFIRNRSEEGNATYSRPWDIAFPPFLGILAEKGEILCHRQSLVEGVGLEIHKGFLNDPYRYFITIKLIAQRLFYVAVC